MAAADASAFELSVTGLFSVHQKLGQVCYTCHQRLVTAGFFKPDTAFPKTVQGTGGVQYVLDGYAACNTCDQVNQYCYVLSEVKAAAQAGELTRGGTHHCHICAYQKKYAPHCPALVCVVPEMLAVSCQVRHVWACASRFADKKVKHRLCCCCCDCRCCPDRRH